ncbi:hypothetical protein [Sphingopyxis sp.]|uniref:hypothetical protein n=1 Tax=Sphingopyxis sp. TaxID=1908224 RepID=UPI003D6CF164
MFQKVIARRRRWLQDLPARTALKLFNRPRVRIILGRRYGEALHIHQPALPHLPEMDAKIVAALEKDGIYVTTIEALDLANGDAVMGEARALAEGFAGEAHERTANGEVFIIVPSNRVVRYPTIYLLGLQDRLLNIAENYIGLPPAYDGVTINYTVADGREVATRKWHRDREDRRMLKVAVYLHDVDESAGPFQMIKRHDRMQNDRDGFNYELADHARLAERLGPSYADDVISCCGPAGTVIFTDTARFFHRGKPATGRDRMAIFYSYFAQNPRHPFLCERTGMQRGDVVRLTTPLPQRQQRAALWRQRLSVALRLIPSATV